ncbi:helix-turn-helix domain-containing protein [Paenirhodobacter hankyongi]|uniref:helix-turn-helix domain-containing protein n=1 Tax=Paenirhodobacter hankyongi TaxID=2294033 RepID=UPI0011C4A455|nr:helix-turn-helix transcriptional regulator [Sinirhodobacter hankyongi]
MTVSTISSHPDNIPEMEAALSERGISVAEMCRRASVAETTWGRWKRKEVSPTFKTWDAVGKAFRALIDVPGRGPA